MSEVAPDAVVLTASGWEATPSNYSSLRTLRFLEDSSGTLVYGYGQTIYAIIRCLWALPIAGVLDLTYLESPPVQLYRGFTPDDANRAKQLTYTLTEGAVEGIESIVARPFRYLWTLELSGSPYPEGLKFPYSIPQVFHGHFSEPLKPAP